MMSKKRDKILYAASTASHLRRFHQLYIKALREAHEVQLMATEGEGIDHPIGFAKSFFSPSNFGAIFKIRKILKKEQFDRVIVHTALAAFLVRAAMLGMRRRPHVLNVVHGYLFSRPVKGFKAKLLLFCEKLMRKKTDAIAVMNREDYEIATAYKLCRGEVTYIPGMGIPDPEELPVRDGDLRAKFAKENEILLTFVGELSGRKNQIFLVQAMHEFRREGIPAKLLLAGEGSEREKLEEEIKSGIDDIVFLPGNLEPIRPYLGITDIYVSASTSEGLPFNVMEAMAAGLPCVLSDTKGQNDLQENDTLHLYPLNDYEAFVDAVRAVYESGNYGAGSVSYPHLEKYRLKSVLDEVFSVLEKGGRA